MPTVLLQRETVACHQLHREVTAWPQSLLIHERNPHLMGSLIKGSNTWDVAVGLVQERQFWILEKKKPTQPKQD